MPSVRKILKDRNSAAWSLMIFSLAVHVFDEAITGFLPFYNQLVPEIREKLGFFPMPTFSHTAWLGGLITAIVVGFCATPLVYRGVKGVRTVTLVLGILMMANACGHMLGSLYVGRFLPGFWSSPLLLFTSSLVVFGRLSRTPKTAQVS